jgi:hypothetical protein
MAFSSARDLDVGQAGGVVDADVHVFPADVVPAHSGGVYVGAVGYPVNL